MVNARFCETARLAFVFASPRHFDFACKLQDRDFKVLKMQARDFQTLKF